MRVAVTGGCGNIGRRTIRELNGAGIDTICLDIVSREDVGPSIRADLCDGAATRRALQGADAVVHLAAIPHPYNDPPERVMGVNTMTSINVFEAVRELGIRRVVYACSESATGFGIHNVKLEPLYVPIDEEHPCWPHETYSLSKYFGERIGENYARAYALEVLSLRYTGVWFAEMEEHVEALLREKRAGRIPDDPWFGAYISVGDVARAILAALKYPAPESPFFEAFLLTAADTFYGVPTLEVLRRIYGETPPVKDPEYFADNPYASVFDIRKARRILGWKPLDRLEDMEDWDF